MSVAADRRRVEGAAPAAGGPEPSRAGVILNHPAPTARTLLRGLLAAAGDMLNGRMDRPDAVALASVGRAAASVGRNSASIDQTLASGSDQAPPGAEEEVLHAEPQAQVRQRVCPTCGR